MKAWLKERLARWQAHQNETIDVDSIDVYLPALPPVLDGYRIAIISDLHIDQLREYHERILNTVAASHPECIFILGDTMDELTGPIDALAPFFTALSQLAPTIAILGNNDCLPGRIHTLRDMYRRSGVTLLENETRLLPARGVPLQVTGLMDPYAKQRGIEPEHAQAAVEKPAYEPLNQTLPPTEKDGYQTPSLLLVHQPQLAPEYAALKPSLILSGHAHGGQIRLPFIGALYAPHQGLFPKLTSGLYPLGNSQLFVSRGLGNHHFPVRVNNRAHLPILTLRAKDR